MISPQCKEVMSKKYSLEEMVIELIRRKYLTLDEGKKIMSEGILSEEILNVVDQRVASDPNRDKKGINPFKSDQEFLKYYLSQRFLVNKQLQN